jgi:hypothetical protein
MVADGTYRSPGELRKNPRRQFHYNASIVIEGGTHPIPCAIVDVSDSGARLQLEDENDLPDHFVLNLTKSGKARRHCKLVWRNGLFMGVQFPRAES